MECVGVQTSPGSRKTRQGNCWTACEHKGRKSKIELDIPLQEHNRFVNGLLERLRGVCRCPNESRITQNEPG
jgi:hypothetical protein